MKTERRPPAPRKGAREASPAGTERRFDGHGVSSGIVVGPAHLRETGAVSVPEYPVPPEKVEDERARFADAVAKSRTQLKKLKAKTAALPAAAAEEIGFLLDAHQLMLTESRLVRETDRRIAEERINAEAAVRNEISAILKGFASMDDAYLAARADDIREVGQRLIRNLTKTPYIAFSTLAKGTIVVAEEITPADTALMDTARIGGFASVLGGAEGHTAIMARSLGLPAVVGATGLIGAVKSGDMVIVDGTGGTVIVQPSQKTLAAYQRRLEEMQRERRRLDGFKRLPSVTRDGTAITLQANIELPHEVEAAVEAGASGVGLLRSEFLFMNRTTVPDEDEQYEVLRTIVEGMGGLPVTVRTLDVGGDKLPFALDGHIMPSANPALGLRAIRLSLREPRLLEAQLGAILRAGRHGPIRILLPMITTTSEMRQVREAMKRVARRLVRRGIEIADPLPPLGAMIEVPGAALAADALAQVCDFFAIGTNDLTMYTLAIDRGDEQVASLYNPLHPAVLRLIQFATEAALRARIPISLCGEMAGDPRYSALLIGLGLRDLSMAVSNLARVKEVIRGLDLTAATSRAQVVMSQTDSGRIAALLDDLSSR